MVTTAEAEYTITMLRLMSSSVTVNNTLSDFNFLAMVALQLDDDSPETLPGRRITIGVSGQQSSVGLGRRHQLPEPGQLGFPAADPSPQRRLTTAHRSRIKNLVMADG